MQFDDMVQSVSAWLSGEGPHADIVVSSRVRLARNVAGVPFVVRSQPDDLTKVLRQVHGVIKQIPDFNGGLVLPMHGVNEVDRQFLVERRLMSREHASNPEGRSVVIGPHESISLMVNEEDHLRLQAMQPGFNLRAGWDVVNAVDDAISQQLPVAYAKDFGYLTCCPTNTGTGLRASVMMHLPALVLAKQINKILQAISKLSLAARGFYGEGTEASGNFFQISNQVTLGQDESELVENLERVITQVVEHEKNAREAFLSHDRVRLEDRIWRAFGTLRSAFIISSTETLDLLSSVRLGVDMGFISGLDRRVVNELFLFTQPAHLQKLEGKQLSATERDTKRAALIRERLGGSGHN